MSLLIRTIDDSDLPNNPSPEQLMEALVEAAVTACRAGVSVSLTEWAALEVPERAALVTARERVDTDRAILAALTSEGPLSRAAAQIPYDGGESYDEALMDQWHDRRVSDASR